MALFPTDAKDGQLLEADNGVYYVYNAGKNVWQSNNVVPKWSDQVFIRGVDNQTQQNVNDTNQEVNVKVGNVATATNQLLDVAFDVRCRGVWIYQGGAVAPDGPPVGLQRFLMTDAEGNKTHDYLEAASLTIHAMGAGQLDKISIGETELGDLITIQNSSDLGGGSYIVTGIEEFHNDNPDELTETYAIYTVTADSRRCSGTIASEEKAVIRIIPQQAVPAFEDEYLPLTGGEITGRLDVTGPVFVADTSSVFKRTASTAASNYILSAEAPLLDPDGGKDVAFRVTADGSVKAGHDTSSPFIASAKNDVITKGYTDDHTLQPDKANDITTSFRIKCDNQTFFSASGGELGLFHLKEPQDVSHAATKGYVDDNFVGLEGNQNIQGNKTFKGDTSFNVSANQFPATFKEDGQLKFWLFYEPDNKTSRLTVQRGQMFKLVTKPAGLETDLLALKTYEDGTLSLQQLRTPTEDHHAASKGYVDKQVGSANQIWAPSKFKYRSDGTTANLNPGEFYVGSSNGERALVIHHSCADGVNWTFFEASVDWKQSLNGPCCIRGIDGTIFFQADSEELITYGLPADRKHVLLKTQNSRRPGNMTNGEEYVIYIPGILPRFILS